MNSSSRQNNNLYGYPLPKALQSKSIFVDTGIGHGHFSPVSSKSNNTSCSDSSCSVKSNQHAYSKYPCAFKNFH